MKTDRTFTKWERPESVPYPSIWSRFDGLKEINSAIPKFWIQDIPENQFETVMQIMSSEFIYQSPFCKYSRITSDPESVEDLKNLYKFVLKDRLGLICYMENPDPDGKPIIAGMSLTHLKQKDRELIKIKGKCLLMILDAKDVLTTMKDAFEEIGSNELLSSVGLYVLPVFRGQGIGLELLKAREPLCKAVGIKATASIFTASSSQSLAARAGFQKLSALDFVDLQKMDPKFQFSGIEKENKDMKYMYNVY